MHDKVELDDVGNLGVIFERDNLQAKHVVLRPGQEIPWHYHKNVNDTFYVVRGPLSIMTRGPERHEKLNAGSVFTAAISQPHRVVNETPHDVEFLLIQGMGVVDFNRLRK